MKTLMPLRKSSVRMNLFVLLLFGCFFGNAQVEETERTNPNKPETELPPDIHWDVKAYRPEAELLKIKAIAKDGTIYDVKAIQNSDDISVLNVKVIVNGKRLPVKLIVKGDDRYYPLKCINSDGTLIDIKAITKEGDILDVKGVSKSGNIIHIRAITKNDVSYNIIAISPDGKVNDVKGIKMLDTEVEAIINGVSIFSHVKALRQN
ncbi:hypothetical protein SAMN04515667_1969 [Formosa sp. Hel1_31_208]|uniref:DUF7486 family protein n=1 Tax=Formosa sp. Hel1_31_208 TaxID=1798225 RepID=UPI00087D57A1|nr:hypothetical protein [Formosa sp. Hel1_31_208]SDS34670.1 hypothetical protein SAMN04515667_1969 [Formosa sp. Hel1_31_208]